MKILIETPSWLGDSVMITPALQNLEIFYPNAEWYLVGTSVATSILSGYKNIVAIYNPSKSGNRITILKNIAEQIGNVDFAISFRTSFYSAVLQFFSHSKYRIAQVSLSNFWILNKFVFKKKGHQVQRYLNHVRFLGKNIIEFDLKLHFYKHEFNKLTLGINAGATYGSAKRWLPERFAEVAIALSSKYQIVLFGSSAEVEMSLHIEDEIRNNGVSNIINLTGKTTIKELSEKIAGLSLFITNDSGSMHIAGAYKIPTVAIFGSTSDVETNQWHNEKSIVVRKNISCSPCKKRECPLKHHNCMNFISSNDVLNAVKALKLDK